MSRFDVFSGLQAEEAESLQAGAVPGEVAAGCGVVGQAGAVQDADGGLAMEANSRGASPARSREASSAYVVSRRR